MTENTHTHTCSLHAHFQKSFFLNRKWCWILSKVFSLLIEMFIQFLFIKPTTSKTTLIKSQSSLIFYLTCWLNAPRRLESTVNTVPAMVSLRKMVKKIICPFHYKKEEEASYGVWHCGSCMKMVASGDDPYSHSAVIEQAINRRQRNGKIRSSIVGNTASL